MIKDILHLKAPGNWINDPNGFICYQGRYHLFYQYFPYAPVWGTMHWGHAVSDDLVHWDHLGVALFPTKEYDRNGIFSGSAIEKDRKMYLYYSAVRYLEESAENIHKAESGRFETSQAMLVSEDGFRFDNWNDKRQIIPVCRDDERADAINTRDPKVWKGAQSYYMVLGSTVKGQEARILFYESPDAVSWEYAGQYRNKKYGRIMECPDLFTIGEQYVFIGSPMGIVDDGIRYRNQTVCALADFKEETCELSLPEQYQYVDYGFELYAPQTTLDREGRRVMIGWMRMPRAVESSDRGEWNGIMCLPRVVEVEEGRVCFRVHPAVDAYFSKEPVAAEQLDFTKPFRIKTELKEGETVNAGGYRIWAEDDRIKTDRSLVCTEVLEKHTRCETPVLAGRYKLDIFVEPNLIEIFVNDGQYVLSSIIYDLKEEVSVQTGEIFAGML